MLEQFYLCIDRQSDERQHNIITRTRKFRTHTRNATTAKIKFLFVFKSFFFFCFQSRIHEELQLLSKRSVGFPIVYKQLRRK